MAGLLAPAKINLTLEILSRRDDGYHTLRSVMLPIALYDRIDVKASAVPTFSSSDPALAGDNLVTRALEAALPGSPFAVALEKTIPVGGGLGGGSSDAAAVLRAAMAGSLGPVDPRDWLAAARALGSDVPFFLCGTGALVEGTGERVTPIGRLPSWWTIVARPHAGVATSEAYRDLDARRASEGGWPSRPRATSASLAAVDAIQRTDFAALTSALINDFHDVVLENHPVVARADAALRRAGAPQVLLSGSGSCLFALFERESEARICATRLDAGDFERTFVVPFPPRRSVALTARRTAILLAGGPSDDISALAPGAPNKAFVPVAGVTLARRTFDALRSTSRIGRIVAVAPLVSVAFADLHDADEIRPAGATMSKSLRSGLDGLPPDDLVVVAASDLPILSAAAVEEFLDLAEGSGADLVYACVEREVHLRTFPEFPHTWAHLRDGTYCGAGLVAMRPRVFAALDMLLGRLGAARKNPLRLASIFGYDILLRYAVGRLSVTEAERRATELLGVAVAAAVCSHPEIAVNVDRVSDVALARDAISRGT